MQLFQMYEDTTVLSNMTNSLYDLNYPVNSELYPQILNIISRFDELFYDTTTITSDTNKFYDDAVTLARVINRRLNMVGLGRLVYKIFCKTTTSNAYSKDIYKRYSQFFDPEVREKLASDKDAPLEVLENLSMDTAYYVSSAARETIRRISRNSN